MRLSYLYNGIPKHFYIEMPPDIQYAHFFNGWLYMDDFPESKNYGANMGPTWGRQDPGGPHVGPMNLAIWVRKNRADSSASSMEFLSFAQLSSHSWTTLKLFLFKLKLHKYIL